MYSISQIKVPVGETMKAGTEWNGTRNGTEPLQEIEPEGAQKTKPEVTGSSRNCLTVHINLSVYNALGLH